MHLFVLSTQEKDYEVRKVLWQEHASSKIKPYLKYKDTDVQGLSFPKNDVENPIWIYWNKGIEQAPIIVQKCYESVCRHSNQKIILLNDQNLADYIRLPDYIEKKKDAGQIPIARYADLMKFALLEHYGGTWIDSTVYLTDPIPDMILNSDFFAVRNSLLLIDNPVLCAVLAPDFKDPIEAKSYISNMDVFIGARMHSTIGAISAGVATIPFSYSKKFEGLFGNLNYPFVISATRIDTDEAVQQTVRYINDKDVLSKAYGRMMPEINDKLENVKKQIKGIMMH